MKSSKFIKPKLIDTEMRDIVLVRNGVVPAKIKPMSTRLIPFKYNAPVINVGGSLVSNEELPLGQDTPLGKVNPENKNGKGLFGCFSENSNELLWFVVLFAILGIILYTRYKMKKEEERQLYILYLRYLEHIKRQEELKRALEEKEKKRQEQQTDVEKKINNLLSDEELDNRHDVERLEMMSSGDPHSHYKNHARHNEPPSDQLLQPREYYTGYIEEPMPFGFSTMEYSMV